MDVALRLARRAVGDTAENPPVGCVLVRDGRIVGRGRTASGGRPHAEAEALARAGDAARGSTAYVTLEPCAHHGRTPPCADALIEAGIARVVVAIEDPDPRVDGAGLARLRAAGLDVSVGSGAETAAVIAGGFLTRMRAGRPIVTLKLATSLDGRIATSTGASRWITGPAARARGHRMRARHDAILIGVGTAIADDPSLDCRLPGLRTRSPIRVVMDGALRLPASSGLVRTARDRPTLVVATSQVNPDRRRALEEFGVAVSTVAADEEGRPCVTAALAMLAESGIGRVLVEGGAAVARSLVAADMVDTVAWFRAPVVLGGDGIPAVGALGLDAVDAAPRFVSVRTESLDGDTLEILRRRP
ncbi:MAG: bifunctional diaminohydroxyphosphoribosylaminopyrimidine deaminase/5-amino-6-(5-phosphoribosylamino)uracil reductase RibD [Alphaproteobacteria bacterium]|nr:bifunctional diaminohydroxyphosphoribosylaminopyrimidine deaminase/5-amino-6-(5-phosphoribosylamino)uracil reductase RibD [Alphaproteobacteria bacterium]